MPITTTANLDSDIELHHNNYDSQQPCSEIQQHPVVCVRGACKSYGVSRNPLVVLDGLNMTVHKGTIYGLLGASGCGKSTLLSCILGQKKLNSGQVCVLGGPPGTKDSGVPGPRVGYMPQQIGLYGDFTVRETLVYFGWIAGMESNRIEERFQMLTKLFMLPQNNQRVKTLSGGEQRRVSLATALVYEPELLVLDEPTVGVDPLLRESIWEYLVQNCKEHKTSVIITTHYIEEARQAHIVGLMREGEILAEESPEQLLARYETQTLEEVFLKLSISQNLKQQRTNSTLSAINNAEIVNNAVCMCSHDKNAKTGFRSSSSTTSSHMKALLWKNVLLWLRNISSLFFLSGLAVVTMAMFCIAVGQEPQNLPIAVVNHETNGSAYCDRILSCNGSQLSCNYIENLKMHSVILVYHTSEEEAEQSARLGKTVATVVVGYNYSDAVRARIKYWQHSATWDVTSSTVHVTLNAPGKDYPIATFLKARFYDTFQGFIRNYLTTCGIDPNVLTTPMRLNVPVYGTRYPNFTDFATPGAVLTFVFMLAILLTSTVMLIEKTEASLERSFVLGVTEMQMLVAHIVCDVSVMVLQSILALTTAFAVFDMTQRGSMGLILALTLSMGFCGMCYGLLVSCLCDTFLEVNLLAVGTFFPIFLLSGVFWPVEGMHRTLRSLTSLLPLTKPTEGMRSILQKNWDFSNKAVYEAFMTTSVWTVLFLIVSVIILKYKRS